MRPCSFHQFGDTRGLGREPVQERLPWFEQRSRPAAKRFLGSRFGCVDGSIEHLAFQQFRLNAFQRRNFSKCRRPHSSPRPSHFLEAVAHSIERFDHVEVVVALFELLAQALDWLSMVRSST